METFTIFLILIIAVCILLVLVIMVQNPKGGGLSSSFGGGSTQVAGGVKKTGDFLDKSTWTLSAILIALILVSNLTLRGNEEQSKVDNGTNTQNPIEETLPDQETTPAIPSGANATDTLQ